jgi:hypothetical protein
LVATDPGAGQRESALPFRTSSDISVFDHIKWRTLVRARGLGPPVVPTCQALPSCSLGRGCRLILRRAPLLAGWCSKSGVVTTRGRPAVIEEVIMRKALAGIAVAAGLALAPALDAVHAQETTEESDDSDNTGLIGLAGLLGLAGLAGLKRRDNRRDTDYDRGTAGTVR